ncbi:hypothetical protein [Terrisporobacter vanillatitrophus]|uniref:hypothetical protein n=1 Tax=Terrisporobacter vanillatitrophus TaxID=3058402 RepID=UPI00336858FA
MEFLVVLKAITDVLKNVSDTSKDIDFGSQIMDLRTSAMELIEKNSRLAEENNNLTKQVIELNKQIEELKKQKDMSDKIELKDNGYWIDEKGPYCTACYHKDGKLIPMTENRGVRAKMSCSECGHTYQTEEQYKRQRENEKVMSNINSRG